MGRASGYIKILLFLTVLSALILLLACYIAFYPISALPLLDALGILVPLFIIINIIFSLFWIFTNKRYTLIIPVISLLIGFFCFGSIYKIEFSNKEIIESNLSIITYNVQEFKYYAGENVFETESNDILKFVNEQDPHVVCFQEYQPVRLDLLVSYPFKYYSPGGLGKSKQAILSKYPIANSGSLNFPNSVNNAIYVDLIIGKDTLRIYNIHLQSYSIYSFRSLIKRNLGIDFLKRLQHTASKHREQVQLLLNHRDLSPHPVVFCGDFNQPAYSPNYQSLLKGMKDTFREKGNGWGTTFRRYIFRRDIMSARIDFILVDEKAFEILEHNNYNIRKSDHLPIMARLKYLSD